MKRILSLTLNFFVVSLVISTFAILAGALPSEPPISEWEKTYGGTGWDGTTHSSVVETNDGGYALAGYTSSFGAGSYDFWLVKVDSFGNEQWNETYGGAGWDGGRSVVQTVDGGYAIAGFTRSFGAGDWDVWLVKTDSDGKMEWNQTYGGPKGDWATSIIQTSDEGYMMTGGTRSFGAGEYDVWLIRVDSFGNTEWNETYGGPKGDEGLSLVQTDDGYVVAGDTYSFGAGNDDFWLVKTDFDGNMQWNQTYGGPDYEEAIDHV